MKAASLREQTDEELRQLQEDMEKELFDLRAKHGAGQGGEVSPLRIRVLRRDIARIKTVFRERETANES